MRFAYALLTAFTFAASLLAQSGDIPDDAAFVLSGRVEDATTGAPIADGIVTFTVARARQVTRPTNAVSERGEIRSGADGSFSLRIRGDGAHLSAAADGYLPGAYGQLWPGGPDTFVTAAASRRDVVIRLWKYASISGTVVRPDGRPAEGIVVTALPLFAAGAPVDATTDGDGRYTITELLPGAYSVAVVVPYVSTPRALLTQLASDGPAAGALRENLARSDAQLPEGDGTPSGDQVIYGPDALPYVGQDGGSVYATEFYAAAETTAAGSGIRLHAGEDRRQVDFQLHLVPAARLSGVVEGPAGPIASIGVHLFAVSDDPAKRLTRPLASTITNAAGQFTMLAVAPGVYQLRAFQRPAADDPVEPSQHVPGAFANDSRPSLWASMPVTVDSQGLSGLQVALSPGPVLRGAVRATLRRSSRAAVPRSLLLVPMNRRLSATPLAIGADGAFIASGIVPGEYTVALPEDGEWALESARFDGRDATRQPFAVTPGEHHLQIETTDRRAELSIGVVGTANLDSARLLIFPASTMMQSGPFREVPLTTFATRVRAVLPAGSYRIVAIAGGAFDVDWREPDVLVQLETLASTVTLVNGQTTELEVHAMEVQYRQ